MDCRPRRGTLITVRLNLPLAILCAAALGCPDKEKSGPKPLVASVLGMTLPLPDGVVADPAAADSVASQSVLSGANDVQTRAWKNPDKSLFQLSLSTASIAPPPDSRGATPRQLFEMVMQKTVATTEREGAKTTLFEPQALDRGLTYRWNMQVERARVVTRGLLVFDTKRGLLNSSAACACLEPDLPLCEKVIAGVTFETSADAVKADEAVH